MRLDEDVGGLVYETIRDVHNSDDDGYLNIGSTATPLPPAPPHSHNHSETEMVLKPGQEITTITPEEQKLYIQTNITLSDLRHLLIVGSDNFGYEKCKEYLDEVFYMSRRLLFRKMQEILSLTSQEKEKVCKGIEELFKGLKFNIIPRQIKLQRPPAAAAAAVVDAAAFVPPPAAVDGLFIGIEKHHFIPLTSFFTKVNCDAFKLFDQFVNELMVSINHNTEDTLINGKTSDRRLFLFLIGVDESYKKAMQSCKINKAELYSDTLGAMQNAGLPSIGIEYQLHDNYDIVEGATGPYLGEGGSKTRRRHPRYRKLVRKTRRGCKSKPKSKRHRRGSIRKNKKYTRKR
jgi:hypothetical protein